MSHSISTREILRTYYLEKDFISSPDGVLKVLSVIACIVVGVVAFATRGGCARAPALAGGAGGLALGAAAALALLAAAALLAAPARAPVLWLYTDVVTSSVLGVLLVGAVVLSAIFCQFETTLGYVYFVAGVRAAATTTGGAALGYAAAMARLDAARPPREPRRPPPAEQDV